MSKSKAHSQRRTKRGTRIPAGIRKELDHHAGEIATNLHAFRANSAVLSSSSPRLIDAYQNKWVGVYQGEIAAAADTLDGVTDRIVSKGIPLAETLIRRIDRERKTFIL